MSLLIYKRPSSKICSAAALQSEKPASCGNASADQHERTPRTDDGRREPTVAGRQNLGQSIGSLDVAHPYASSAALETTFFLNAESYVGRQSDDDLNFNVRNGGRLQTSGTAQCTIVLLRQQVKRTSAL